MPFHILQVIQSMHCFYFPHFSILFHPPLFLWKILCRMVLFCPVWLSPNSPSPPALLPPAPLSSPPSFPLPFYPSVLSLQGVVSVVQLLCSCITRWSNTQCGITLGRWVHVCFVCARLWGFFYLGQIRGSVCPQKWEWTEYVPHVHTNSMNVFHLRVKKKKFLLTGKENMRVTSLVFHFSEVTLTKLDTECATEKPRVCERKGERWREGERRKERLADMFVGQLPFLFSGGRLEAHLLNGRSDSSAPAVS